MSKNFKTFFVVNPKAGGGRGKRVWNQAREELESTFGSVDFEFTNSSAHAILLTSDALKNGYEMVVAVGGDGTCHEVLNGFFENGHPISADAILGILPAGTGGDFLRSIKYPKELSDRIGRLSGKKTRQVDIGTIAYQTFDGMKMKRYFLNIAGCGLSGELVREIGKVSRRYGSLVAYLTGLVKALSDHTNQEIVVTVDGSRPIRKRSLCTIVANGQYFGSGMHIAPDAVIDDGWLDLVMIGDLNFGELMAQLPRLFWGNVRKHPKVEVFRAQKVRIESAETVLIDMDGEQQGVLPATYSIIPKAITLKI
jgi:YegS/Rv2252/BmrU family lipid kinase